VRDLRKKNANWCLRVDENGDVPPEDAVLGVLMDIRDELHGIQARLNCHDTLCIPTILRDIRMNTTKPPKKRRKTR